MRALILAAVLAQITFRSGVDAVQIPVSVRDGNKPVANLTAADFQVQDNGVTQAVQAITVENAPVDVTLIVDTSGSTTGIAEKFTKDVQEIVKLMRPTDGFRLLRIDTLVEELRPMSPVSDGLVDDLIPRNNGMSSVYDALLAALVRPSSADRRQFIVAITDAYDTMSPTTAERLKEVARRSDALLELVVVNRPPSRGRLTYQRPLYSDFDPRTLAQVAESTGGELRGVGVFGNADAVGAFKKVFNDFRQSYVLRYTPRGVSGSGWHELSVSIPASPKLVVRARRGYFAGVASPVEKDPSP
jgi:VWFA-related protein